MNRYSRLSLFLFFISPFFVFGFSPYPDSLEAVRFVEMAAAKAASNRDSSLRLLNAGLEIFKKNNDLRSWINACKNTGVAFDMAGQMDDAMSVYGQATSERLFRQPENRKEWEALGWLYANAGFTLSWYGKYFDAKSWYEKSRSVFEDDARWVDTTVVAYVHRELGNIYTRLGDYEAAVLMLERVKKVSLEARHFNLAAEACNDMAIVFEDNRQDSLSILTCREALAFPGISLVSQALLKGTLALAYFNAGRRQASLAETTAAKTLLETVIRKNLHPNGKLWLSNLLKLRGELLEDPNAARQSLDQSLALLKEFYPDTLRREFAKVRLALSGFHLRRNQPEEALRQQQIALQSVLYRFRPTDFFQNPSSEDFYPENTLMEALSGKAEAFRQLYRRKPERPLLLASLTCHDLIFEAERAYRQVHHFESSKLTLLAESSRRTASAIETAWQFHRDFQDAATLGQAFSFAEKSKSILLYEALRQSGASSLANIPDSLLQKERQLKEELAEAEKALFFAKQKGETAGVDQLEKEIFDLNASLSNLNGELESNYPAFFKEKNRKETATVAAAQALLLPSQALIEYFVGDSVLFIFLLKKNAFHLERVAKDFPLEQWVTQFRQDIEAFQFPGSDREALCRSYTELAQLLFHKLVQPLTKFGLPENLVIVPGGILGFLPFDALLYEAPPSDCVFKKYPYLVRKYNISYNYSSTLFKELMQVKKKKARAGFAGFAPSFPEGNNSGFGPLHFNIVSAQEAAAIWDGTHFSKSAATRRALRENAAGHSILYLSTHAKANTDEGNFSFIVLAKEGGGYDTLFVTDIYNLKLASDLVFLGACETGSGKWYNGEGIISLARSFLYAGARSIVTTLWSINDESNKNLTLSFFRHLHDGQRKDEALRRAKLELLENSGMDLYAHPVFWAAYTPIGNMEPVSSGIPWWHFLVGGVGLLTIIILCKSRSGWQKGVV